MAEGVENSQPSPSLNTGPTYPEIPSEVMDQTKPLEDGGGVFSESLCEVCKVIIGSPCFSCQSVICQFCSPEKEFCPRCAIIPTPIKIPSMTDTSKRLDDPADSLRKFISDDVDKLRYDQLDALNKSTIEMIDHGATLAISEISDQKLITDLMQEYHDQDMTPECKNTMTLRNYLVMIPNFLNWLLKK